MRQDLNLCEFLSLYTNQPFTHIWVGQLKKLFKSKTCSCSRGILSHQQVRKRVQIHNQHFLHIGLQNTYLEGPPTLYFSYICMYMQVQNKQNISRHKNQLERDLPIAYRWIGKVTKKERKYAMERIKRFPKEPVEYGVIEYGILIPWVRGLAPINNGTDF